MSHQPADRSNIYALLAPALGCRYATVVAERREDGYHVDHDVLLRVIDRAWNEMERQR